MNKKNKINEIISFYQENDFNEVYDNLPNLKFGKLSKKTTKKNPKDALQEIPTEIPKKISREKNLIIKNEIANSTSQALSKLAKRSFENSNNFNQESQEIKKDLEFIPLNEIVLKAQKLAKEAQNIHELKTIVENFDGCNLKKMATNTVFCDGNPNSKIMVIGEAPGNNEDLQGIPFCGDSGELLDAMFSSIHLNRKNDFYITNVIFWRPPGNRRPTDEEVAICRPFVERHIELFAPKLIILVGATAMSAIIKENEPISKIRGKLMDSNLDFLKTNCKLLTIFHPSFLMRQPAKKKLAWRDMLNLKEFIENKYE